jgi:hypothetical protein
MTLTLVLVAALFFFFGYQLGVFKVKTIIASRVFEEIRAKAMIPVCVAECVGQTYYLYEKDTDKFMCQASSFEELPQSLFDTRKINLALVLFPTASNSDNYWIINGKIKKLETK